MSCKLEDRRPDWKSYALGELDARVKSLTPHLKLAGSEDLNTRFKLLERVEALVTHELGLIGNRMTWFAISQSFLLGGCYIHLASDPKKHLWEILVLATVGFLFALAALHSTMAADKVLEHLDTARGRLLKTINGHDDIKNLKSPCEGTAAPLRWAGT